MPYTTAMQVDTVTVSSTTSPVVVLAPGFRSTGILLRNEDGGTTCRVWPFQGTNPVSVPPKTYQLSASNTLNANLASASSGVDAGLGDGWAAVLQTAGSAVIDILWS